MSAQFHTFASSMSSTEITINDLDFELFIQEKEIQNRVEEMARSISEEYAGQDLVVIGVLNGVFMFFSDLVKSLSIDVPINFVKVASYTGTQTSGKVRELVGFSGELKGRHVLVVDDILDSGYTYSFIIETLKAKAPASIKFACLLYKPEALKVDLKPDYAGFEIPNEFVVGYGLDYNQLGRTYRDIYKKK